MKNVVVVVGLLLIACPVGADLVYPLMVPVNCSVLLYPPNNVGAANPSLRWSLQGDTCIIIRVRDLGLPTMLSSTLSYKDYALQQLPVHGHPGLLPRPPPELIEACRNRAEDGELLRLDEARAARHINVPGGEIQSLCHLRSDLREVVEA
jgi:hypothetical protein